MIISATIANSGAQHEVAVATNGVSQHIPIPAKSSGPGSQVNGGELLCLALATCYCNDLYREAAKKHIRIDRVEVEVTSEFGGPGEAGRNFRYLVGIKGNGTKEELAALALHTDTVAEIQNTLRAGSQVQIALR